MADLDPMRDGSVGMKKISLFLKILTAFILEYQKLLDKAGVKTKLVRIEGVVHAFFALPGKRTTNSYDRLLVA